VIQTVKLSNSFKKAKYGAYISQCTHFQSSVTVSQRSAKELGDKGKGAVPQWGLGEVLISQTSAVEPVGG